MAPLHRLLVGLSVVLMLTGLAAVATHRSSATAGVPSGHAATPDSSTLRSGTTPAPATTRPATVSTAPARRGPDTAALEAGLVTPTDMGGYYRTVPSTGAALVGSSPCLEVLGPAPAQTGRAVTALLGPDDHSVPTVVEVVASYPGTSARSLYQAAVRALDACSILSFDFGGPVVTARLAPGSIPPVGGADRVWSGSFTTGAATLTVDVGVVLSGQDILALIWIDSVPPSDPVMGSFVSTLSLAIGKLA